MESNPRFAEPVIERPVGLVVSGGRTGTAFLGTRLQHLFENATVFHEADAIHRRSKTKDLIWSLKKFGIYRGFLGKLIGQSGAGHLSRRYLSGDISESEAARELVQIRNRLYNSAPRGNLVIETNYSMYGLLPVLPNALKQYRVAAIIRRPEDFIRSWLRMGQRYGRKDWLHFAGLRLTPARFGDYEAARQWSRMSRAERLAWFWTAVYTTIDHAARYDPNIKIFRFEDLFKSPDRHQHLGDMLSFLGNFETNHFPFSIPHAVLDVAHNASAPDALPSDDGSPSAAAEKWCADFAGQWYCDSEAPRT